MKGDPPVSFALMGEVPVITFGSDLEQICRRICTESVQGCGPPRKLPFLGDFTMSRDRLPVQKYTILFVFGDPKMTEME